MITVMIKASFDENDFNNHKALDHIEELARRCHMARAALGIPSTQWLKPKEIEMIVEGIPSFCKYTLSEHIRQEEAEAKVRAELQKQREASEEKKKK